jgi:hypothetical protein
VKRRGQTEPNGLNGGRYFAKTYDLTSDSDGKRGISRVTVGNTLRSIPDYYESRSSTSGLAVQR